MNDTFENTEEIGIDAAKKIITQEFGWIFREKNKRDKGIDAEAETKLEGLLIQIQIKTGIGNFRILKRQNAGLTYYVDKYHYEYWTNLQAPVLFIAHIPDTNKTYWQIITQQNLQKTTKGWKLFIPYANELNLASKEQILYFCINLPEPEVRFKIDIENKKVTYQSNVINVSKLSGFNSQREIESRQLFAKKTLLLQRVNQLRKLAYDNPNNYPCRIELSTVYIDLNDLNNATFELTSLISNLSKPELKESFYEQFFLIWAKYYLHVISQQQEDYKYKIDNTILIMLAKVEISGKNTVFAKPTSVNIRKNVNTFKMIDFENYCFIIKEETSIKSILNDLDFEYQVSFNIIPNKMNIIPKIDSYLCKFEFGLMLENHYFNDYSIPFPN